MVASQLGAGWPAWCIGVYYFQVGQEKWNIVALLYPQTSVEDVQVKLPVTFPGLVACMIHFDGTRLEHHQS